MSSADHAGTPPRVYLNGRVLDPAEARITPFDRGFLYGDGFFETTRIIAGSPLFLHRHLDRLASSCHECGFGETVHVREIEAGVRALIEANAVGEGYLRITVSRGPYRGRLDDLATEAPTVFIEARPMALPPLDAVPCITLARSPFRRNEHSPLVRHKSLSYQANVLALAEVRRRGADEVYFLNSQGQLAEGAVTNLFFVRQGVVCTPDIACGLLPGIARQVVLDLCVELGLPVRVGVYAEENLREADEVFCTNSLRGVMGVAGILEYPGKALSACPVTSHLRALYAERACTAP